MPVTYCRRFSFWPLAAGGCDGPELFWSLIPDCGLFSLLP